MTTSDEQVNISDEQINEIMSMISSGRPFEDIVAALGELPLFSNSSEAPQNEIQDKYITYTLDHNTMDFKVEEDGSATLTSGDLGGRFARIPAIIKGESGKSYPVKKINAGAFTNNQAVKCVVISEGIEELGDGAFAYSGSLMDIVLPASLKKLHAAFWNVPQFENNEGAVIRYTGTREQWDELLNSSPTRIMMDNTPYEDIVEFIDPANVMPNDTEYRVIKNEGTGAEELCLRLCNEYGTFPVPDAEYDKSGRLLPVTEIGRNAFSGNNGIEIVFIPATIRRICQDAFYGCENLKEVVIDPSADKIDIDTGAFFKCENLEVVHMGREANLGQFAFEKCPKVQFVEDC